MIDYAAAPIECVVLLHGLGRTSRSMARFERTLQDEGYAVANIDYPSRKYPIESLAPEAVGRGLEACRKMQAQKIHFVTHSLGGILVRYFLSYNDIPELGRVVMLATPNQGTEVVDLLCNLPGFAVIAGPAGPQLGTGPGSIPNALGPVSYPVGVIAGTRTINPIFSAVIPGADDGMVSVARTMVNGMSDFAVVRASHTFVMRNPEVIRQSLAFISTGSFAY